MALFTPLAIRIGGLSWLPRFLPQILWLDRLIQRLTRGRHTLSDLAGLPNGVLTVPGRTTGQPRSTPLLCFPYGSRYVVAGSCFGGPEEPLWVANLTAAGRATLRVRGRPVPVTARRIRADERAPVWDHLLGIWPNFAKYEQRTNREIKLFELTPTS
jgi:deazaflavin-dependent oxidoreductase (nitroreductase family)